MADTADKVIKVAEAEVGYLEKKSNSQLDSKTGNAGRNNYTKYWRDLASGMNGNAWCNCFVNWCFVQAFGSKRAKELLCSEKGWSYYTPTSSGYFKSKNQWQKKKKKKGDIIYFRNSERICHVGLVYKVEGGRVYTIEGNTSSSAGVVPNGGCVAKKSYELGLSRIAGYGRPKYDGAKSEPESKVAQPTLKKGSKGDEVKKLQKNLNKLGFKDKANKPLVEDGDFGAKTEEALKKFQKEKSLEVDGIYGQNSYKAMSKVIK